MRRRLLLLAALAALALLTAPARAQDGQERADESRRVEIIAPSDSLVQLTERGERVQKLIGNVHLRQGTTLLNADRATRYRRRGEILFTGDVLIIDEGDSLWADRVRYDSRQKVGHATGNVRVADGEVLMAGPSGRYFFDEKHAVFPERVMLVDSVRVLKSRGGEYFSRQKRAEFYHQVHVFSDSTYLEADSVTYHRRTEVSSARGHVFIERRGDRAASGEEETELPAPRGKREEGIAAAGVLPDTARATARTQRPSLLGRPLPVDTTRRALLPDTTARALLWGDDAYNDPRSGYSRVTGRALLVRLQPPGSSDTDSSDTDSTEADSTEADSTEADSTEADSTEAESARPPRAQPPRAQPPRAAPDTLIVQAHRLETTRSDTLRRLTATDSVRLWQGDLGAVADSAVYDQWPAGAAERAPRRESRFFGTPFSWSKEAQVSGDSLRVTGRGGAVRRLYARGHAFLAQQDSVLPGRLQQLKGRRLTGFFAPDSAGETTLKRLTARPNAEVIYFSKTDDGALKGAVRASSDSIYFQMQGGNLRKVGVLSGVEGRRYEAEDVPDPFHLEGLVWVPERRPRKETFLTEERVRRRLIRPTPPEAPVPEVPMPEAPAAAPPPAAAASAAGE